MIESASSARQCNSVCPSSAGSAGFYRTARLARVGWETGQMDPLRRPAQAAKQDETGLSEIASPERWQLEARANRQRERKASYRARICRGSAHEDRSERGARSRGEAHGGREATDRGPPRSRVAVRARGLRQAADHDRRARDEWCERREQLRSPLDRATTRAARRASRTLGWTTQWRSDSRARQDSRVAQCRSARARRTPTTGRCTW